MNKTIYPCDITKQKGLFLWQNHPNPKTSKSLIFIDPVDQITLLPHHDLNDLLSFFSRLEQGLKKGLYAAGWLSYEAGYLLIPRLNRLLLEKRPELPLGWFGLYQKPIFLKLNQVIIKNEKSPQPELFLNTNKESFKHAIKKIHYYIKHGDTYQINYTIKGRFNWEDDPFNLYLLLNRRQRARYSCFVRPFNGLEVLSISPELFFQKDGKVIWSKPMKGTAPRGQNKEEDEKKAHSLRADEKNQAENVMIVDLLRNDLGRICKTGTVSVPKLFEVEKYETLFQMTSTVKGQLKNDVSWFDIFSAIFPCGSITGAPKIRSMEIISELEKSPRGIYTGAIGYITPQNKAIFNVAIRTITIQNGKAELGIGAGITIGSDADSEFDETVLKAAFLTREIRQTE